MPVLGRSGPDLASILRSSTRQVGVSYDVDVLSGVSEPYGSDAAVADGSVVGAALSQSGAAGHVGRSGRAAHRRARADLALGADLSPPGLRHRPRHGRQPRGRRHRGGRLRDAIRLAAAFQEGRRGRAAARAAGGADVRPFRHAAARHGADAAAGPRRLHHRLAQSARHPAQQGPLRARRLHRASDRFPRPSRPAPAHGGDLPAVGVGARGRCDHVRGQPSLPPGHADADGGPDRYARAADEGQRLRQEQADRVVRAQLDQLRADAVRRCVPKSLSGLRAAHRLRLDESRAPHQAASRPRQPHRQGRGRKKAEIIKTFYDEYFAVMDLPAEFYIETVRDVFQEHLLPQGKLMHRGRPVNTKAVGRMGLMTVEGEKDDICSIGQTLAAQDLCTGVRAYRRVHHMQAGVGHYGVFSGRRWNNEIYPLLRDFVHVNS